MFNSRRPSPMKLAKLVKQTKAETPAKKKSFEEYNTAVPVSPDGGYGWVIVAIAFMGTLTVDGIAYTFYIFRPGLIEDGLSESDCAISISTVNALSMLVAPISSSLCNAIGFRLVMMLGSLIATMGFTLAYFSYEFYQFYLSYGILSGFGLGLMYLPMTIPAGLWFDATRPFAMGLATCGTGVGMITMPFFFEYLISIMHHRYLFFVISGIMSINIFSALLIREVPLVEIEIEKGGLKPVMKQGKKGITASEYIGQSLYRIHEKTPYHVTQSSHRVLQNDMRISRRWSANPMRLRRLESPSMLSVAKDEGCKACCDFCSNWCSCCCSCSFEVWCQQTGHRPMYKADIFYHGSIFRFKDALARHNVDTAIKYSMHVSRLPTQKDVEEQIACKICCPESLVRSINSMGDYHLFKIPSFLLYCGSSFCFYLCVTIPILYMNKFMEQNSKAEDGKPPLLEWILPLMGFGLFFGRLGGGVLLQLVPTLSSLGLCAGLSGLITMTTLIVSFNFHYYYNFAYAFIFGMCFGLYVSARSLIIVDYVGLDNLTSATGILFAIGGIANLLGPPITVAITRNGEHMQMAFEFSSFMFCSSTLFLLAMFFTKKP